MENFQHINSSKKRLYDSYDELPKRTKDVYAALQLMYGDTTYMDDNLKFMPTNRQISEVVGIKNNVSHYLAVLDRNGYIWVTWGHIDSLYIRKHKIELLNKKIA